MNTYIWSDLHLTHSNIIKYENRPFENVEAMNKTLLKNWRDIVKKSDTIINLGDFVFNPKTEVIKKTLQNLPGYKILILGNHDFQQKSFTWWKNIGFDEVYKYPIIYDGFYILSHEPIYLNENMPYVNIHGHIHGRTYKEEQYINVCVEHTNYKPILFDDIKAKFQDKMRIDEK